MLQTIRDRTHGWIAGIIISLLIMAFAMWGISSYLGLGAENNVVAKVNGEEITKRQFATVFEPLRNQAQITNGGILSIRTQDALKQQAIDLLINIQVLKQASLADKYRVSIPQIDNYIKQMPQFQVNGQFSAARLQQILANNMIGPDQFLDSIGTTLLIDQPRLGIILSSFALPNEIATNILLVNQQRDIEYVTIAKDQFLKEVSVTPEEIQTYYNQHKEDYKTLEQVSIDYLQLSVKDLMKTINVTDDEMKKAYKDNQNSYVSSKDVKKLKIQTFEESQNKIKEDLQRQKAEEVFASTRDKLANLTYESPSSLDSAAKGLGLPIKHTGLFTHDKGNSTAPQDDITQNAKVREVAFSSDVLTSNNNSDVISISPDTVIVLRVKEHKPASVEPLNVVEKQISERLQMLKSEEKAKAVADQIVAELQKGMTSQQITDKYHVTWSDAGYVGRYDSKVDSAILYGAFKVGKPAGKNAFASIKVPAGYAVVAVTDIKQGSPDVNQEQNDAFIDQIQNSVGSLEYTLYEKSLMKEAKIVNNLNTSS